MAINNVTLNRNVSNVTTSTMSTAEKERESLKNQIAGKEQRLNRLSSDSQMTAEEKAKERQEVQKQIQELNRKLRLLQMEKEEEAREAAKEKAQQLQAKESDKTEVKESEEKRIDGVEKENPQLENIQKVLVSDSAIQQSRIQESVTGRQDAKIRVLETEIKLDKLYGTDTSAKQEKLSELSRKKRFEIEPKEQENKAPDYEMDSGAKIVIR